MRLGIVLLNYKNYFDTIECIESIEKQSFKDFFICVVDNDSNNNSIKNIEDNINKKYKNIFYIQNQKNLGFAKGNNEGIKFLKEKMNCNWIYVLNTDTVIEDKKFLEKVFELSSRLDNDVAILNPMCYDMQYKFSYPSFRCKNSINKYIRKLGIEYFKYLIKSMFNINKINVKNIDLTKLKELEDYKYTIQGCAYFLTPNFFKYYDGLFPDTFLYCEELALAIYLERHNLKTKNIYDLNLMHKEGGSTTHNGGITKKINKYFQMIESYKIVKKMYKNIKNYR